MMSADWRVTSVDDVAMMMPPRADVNRRRPGAWRRVTEPGGTRAFAQNILAVREGAWELR